MRLNARKWLPVWSGLIKEQYEAMAFQWLVVAKQVEGRRWGAPIVGWAEVITPTAKQLVGIVLAIAMAFVSAAAFGISAAEHSATQVPTKHFTTSNGDFRLADHQRLRKILLGQEGIELPLR